MGPHAGKSLVALGLMELLSARAQAPGFFRPIVSSGEGPDAQLELVRARYGVAAEYDELYALSDTEAQAAIAAGDHAEIEKRVLEAYRRLAARFDVIVCEGTDFAGSSPALDFDLNAHLANAIGAPVLVVVRGSGADEVAGAVSVARESLVSRGCQLFGVIVSRVPLGSEVEVSRALEPQGGEPPVYVIPEQPELTNPTVAEVATALGAEPIGDARDGLGREVRAIRVAGMGVGHFLADLEEATLVIVPGDRDDIAVASVASTLSAEIPAIAGLVLTAGYELDPGVRRLVEGAPFPVMTVPDRTYDVATRVSSVRPQLTVGGERKVAAALGAFSSSVDPVELGERIALERPARMTPAMFEYELIERAKEDPRHIVLPEGEDDRVLRAADILLRRGVVTLTILGKPDEIAARGAALGLDLSEASLVDPAASGLREMFAGRYHELRKHKGVTEDLALETVADQTYFGTLMVSVGEADGMVSGAAHTTGDTIRPAFEIIKARKGAGVVSSVFLMCFTDRVLVYGDCAVNPKPDAEQLADIAISSADTAFSFGVDPLVAMLSYSTGESGKGEDVDLVRAATEMARERRPDLKFEGPIQYDASIDPGVAEKKLPGSEVAGQATVFIFPDLNTGNIAYKAVQRSSGAVAIGPVLQGLNKPVNDLSRGCKVPDIVSTVVITAIQAQEAGGRSTSRLRMRLPAA